MFCLPVEGWDYPTILEELVSGLTFVGPPEFAENNCVTQHDVWQRLLTSLMIPRPIFTTKHPSNQRDHGLW